MNAISNLDVDSLFIFLSLLPLRLFSTISLLTISPLGLWGDFFSFFLFLFSVDIRV